MDIYLYMVSAILDGSFSQAKRFDLRVAHLPELLLWPPDAAHLFDQWVRLDRY